MCGIAGRLNFGAAPIDRAGLERMSGALVHRGPDDSGLYVAGPVGLAQRRLAIIDLSETACPPLSNADHSIWIVFNGEIYNFQALRQRLVVRGHRFRTKSDTEVIVHAYEEYGAAFVSELRGMFALAIWDARKQSLFVARDRLGKKPLYYHHDTSRLVFASEIRALLQAQDLSVEPNLPAIASYLRRQCVPHPQTAFAGIMSLPPGHYLTCGADRRLTITRYWEPPLSVPARNIGFEEAREEALEIVRESVRLRLISDVPVGAMLSAGIDSGLVVALMAEQSHQPVRTFTVGFEGYGDDERAQASVVARAFGTQHHEITVAPDVAGILGTIVHMHGQPFADSSAIAAHYVSQTAARHVKVALSGDGGDESFCGYQHYLAARKFRALSAIPGWIRSIPARAAARAFDSFGPRLPNLARAATASRMLAMDWPEMYAEHTATFKIPELRRLASDGLQGALASPLGTESTPRPEIGEDSLDYMMRVDRSGYLPDCLLAKMDIASMTHSLELRCPLLDHELVEFAANLPLCHKTDGRTGKLLLRSLASELLPVEVATRRKTGFGVPMAQWLRDSLRPTLEDLLGGSAVRARGLFRPEFVQVMVAQHDAGARDWSNRLWSLMVLEQWFREFVDRGGAPARAV